MKMIAESDVLGRDYDHHHHFHELVKKPSLIKVQMNAADSTRRARTLVDAQM